MAAYKRISRSRKRELEEPDEFITVSSQVLTYISEYSKQIAFGALAVVVLILVISGMKYYSLQKEQAAQVLLGQTIEKYEAEKIDAAPEKLYEALKPDFEILLDKYSGTNAAKVARYIYADICFNAKDYQTAETLYLQSLKDYKGQTFFSDLARRNLAYTYEAQQKYQDAIAQMTKVSEQEKAKMKDDVLFNLGRLHALNGQSEEKAASLEKILAEFPNSNYSGIAKERLAQ